MKTLATFLESDSGSALIETALSLMVYFLLLFGTMGAALALYVDHYVSECARSGTRYAMVRGSTWSGTSCASPQTEQCAATASDVQKYVIYRSPAGFPTTALSVTTTWTGNTPSGAGCDTTQGSNSPQCVVQVQVSYGFRFLVPYLQSPYLTIKSKSALAITQ